MEIKGNGFTLRRWTTGDAARLQQLADNPKIFANLYDRFPSPYTLADAEFFINLKMSENPPTSLVIDVDGDFAGTIGITVRDDVFAKSPLFGYWLGEEYWGRGIMTNAAKLFVTYAFETFDVICLQAGVFAHNPASMRVLEKAGFTKQGVFTGTLFKNNQVIDEHVFIAYPPNKK